MASFVTEIICNFHGATLNAELNFVNQLLQKSLSLSQKISLPHNRDNSKLLDTTVNYLWPT